MPVPAPLGFCEQSPTNVGRVAMAVSGSAFESANPLLLADAYHSGVGPYEPGDYGGGVGSNLAFDINSTADITGTLWIGDDEMDVNGLDADALAGNANDLQRLDLPCGRYYLSDLDQNSSTAIVARGNSALFIDGDVDANSELCITVEPTGQLDSNGGAAVHYDRRITTIGDECPDPGPGPADAGYPDASDDGDDEVCKTENESCRGDSDCCSPLVCVDGQCSLLECKGLNEQCEDDEECCSETCGGGVCIDG